MKIREQNTAIRGLTCGKTPQRALAVREEEEEEEEEEGDAGRRIDCS